MEEYRSLFRVTERWAYLNHCAVSPLATPVVETMQRFLEDQQLNGVMRAPNWWRQVKDVRSKAAALINARPQEIAFIRSTVEGVSLVAEGLSWREGDNIVTVHGEYPANVYPWQNLARFGVATRVVPDRAGRVALDDIFAAVDSHTRLIALSFVEFLNGFRNDLVSVGEFCRRRGIHFFVDAIQGLGALPLDVEACQIDFLAAGAQKWLLGPIGIGIFYCRLDRLDDLQLIQVGPASMVPKTDYLPYEFRLRQDAQRFEPGAHNYPGIVGLGAILDVLIAAAPASIERHIWDLLDVAVDGLQQRGCELLSSLEPKDRSGMIAFRSPAIATADLEKRLVAASVAVSARSGGVRVAPHLYNNRSDIERLLAEVPEARV